MNERQWGWFKMKILKLFFDVKTNLRDQAPCKPSSCISFPFLSDTSIDTTKVLQTEFSTSSLNVPIYDVKPSTFGIDCYFTISPQLTFFSPYGLASLIQSKATEDN